MWNLCNQLLYRFANPTSRKKPTKICNLRVDSLAQLLTLSNVQSSSQVMIVETCIGLVLGAVAERLGGTGRILNFYYGSQPSVSLLNNFNFTPATMQTIFHYPLNLLPPTQTRGKQTPGTEKIGQHLQELSDSLIVATKYDPNSVFFALYPYLALSRPFVVFSQYLEPLTACYNKLLHEEAAINLDLAETWMREYQILPGRIHPHMMMHGASGYVLSGIKVQSSPITAPEPSSTNAVQNSDYSSAAHKRQKS